MGELATLPLPTARTQCFIPVDNIKVAHKRADWIRHPPTVPRFPTTSVRGTKSELARK